jgi:hypothetical protein
VTYKEVTPGTTDLVENAEKLVKYLALEFEDWLAADIAEMQAAWEGLKASRSDPKAFLRFRRAVHTVFGNAPSLNEEGASQLAKPLTRLLERAPDIAEHIHLVDTAVDAIVLAVLSREKPDREKLGEISEGLEVIVDRWIERRN